MKNWWYYHKWYVICGTILLLILVDLIGNALGWFKKSPDLQIAYIGESELSEDATAALEEAFSSLADDYNRDGETLVQVNQYASGRSDTEDPDAAAYREASLMTLMGDVNDCQSYFFLMEDPDHVQREFQVLAMPDGSCPDETDSSVEGKVFRWSSCRLVPDNEELDRLYLGRRCFYDDRHCVHTSECSQLWNTLQGGLH